MKLIALDVGAKRIGIAKADSSVRIAIPAGVVEVDGGEFNKIAAIARVYGTSFFIIGLPRNAKGEETAQSAYVRDFAKRLKAVIKDAKICFQDESLTSVVAEERLDRRRKTYKKGDIDAEAATIILQDFLETHAAGKSAPQIRDAKELARDTKKGHVIRNVLISLAAVCLVAATAAFVYFRLRPPVEDLSVKCADYDSLSAEDAETCDLAGFGRITFSVMFVPGESLTGIKEKILNTGYYTPEEIEAAFAKTYDHPVLIDKPASASLEGYIYGNTYEFYKTATVEEIITTTLDELYSVVTKNNLVEAFAGQGLTLYQGITLASIIQKESASPADDPIIAQIFYSRLANGMNLGSDVTAKYAADLIDPDRTIYIDNAAVLGIDSPYNTRLYSGLPPGPICNPGLDAMLAVASPADTSYLFFLTGDDGMMYYSFTDEEHQQNIIDHCSELCNASL